MTTTMMRTMMQMTSNNQLSSHYSQASSKPRVTARTSELLQQKELHESYSNKHHGSEEVVQAAAVATTWGDRHGKSITTTVKINIALNSNNQLASAVSIAALQGRSCNNCSSIGTAMKIMKIKQSDAAAAEQWWGLGKSCCQSKGDSGSKSMPVAGRTEEI